jgi:hypothetical protein
MRRVGICFLEPKITGRSSPGARRWVGRLGIIGIADLLYLTLAVFPLEGHRGSHIGGTQSRPDDHQEIAAPARRIRLLVAGFAYQH